jgi:hypothetical protein
MGKILFSLFFVSYMFGYIDIDTNVDDVIYYDVDRDEQENLKHISIMSNKFANDEVDDTLIDEYKKGPLDPKFIKKTEVKKKGLVGVVDEDEQEAKKSWFSSLFSFGSDDSSDIVVDSDSNKTTTSKSKDQVLQDAQDADEELDSETNTTDADETDGEVDSDEDSSSDDTNGTEDTDGDSQTDTDEKSDDTDSSDETDTTDDEVQLKQILNKDTDDTTDEDGEEDTTDEDEEATDETETTDSETEDTTEGEE